MSAGTIIACACKEIYMGAYSSLGPVDPQVNGLPAYAVLEGIKLAYNEIVQDQMKVLVWNPILSRYTVGFVQQCSWATQAANDMVSAFLKDNMFSNLPPAEREKIAADIVDKLTSKSSDKGHDKHIEMQHCIDMGLNIVSLDDDSNKKLQDLVLTVHHCYMNTLSNTAAFKIIENHLGRRFVKIAQQILIQQMPSPSLAPGGPPN